MGESPVDLLKKHKLKAAVCGVLAAAVLVVLWRMEARGCMCPSGYDRYHRESNSNSCDCEGDMISCQWRCPVPGDYNSTICFNGNEQLSSCDSMGGERGMAADAAGGGRVFCPDRTDYCDCSAGGCRNDVNLCGCDEAQVASCCGAH